VFVGDCQRSAPRRNQMDTARFDLTALAATEPLDD